VRRWATAMAPVQGRGWHQWQPTAVPALTAIRALGVDDEGVGKPGSPVVGLVAAVS
jgi:hypothetical protein